MVVSICASNQHQDKFYRIRSSDANRTYVFAKAERLIFTEMPPEDHEEGDEGRVGRLNLSLHGTRDAALNWQIEFIDLLTHSGFHKGKASPCNIYRPHKYLYVIVHGDDFVIAGFEVSFN